MDEGSTPRLSRAKSLCLRRGDPFLRVAANEDLTGATGDGGKPEAGQRLMRIMGLRAIYRGTRTSRMAPGHRIYPYLLAKADISRPNHV